MNTSMIAIGLCASVLLLSCGDTENKAPKPSTAPIEQSSTTNNEDNRDKYLKPYEVFENIGGVGGKKVADINAGDGYLCWKLLKAGASVVAVCHTQEEYDAMIAEKKSRGISDADLELRLKDMTGLGVKNEEVDILLMHEGLCTKDDPIAFTGSVFKALKRGGIFCNIEWKDVETPVGPSVTKRFDVQRTMDILADGGFSDVAALSKLLPYQNVFIGMEYLGDPGVGAEQTPA